MLKQRNHLRKYSDKQWEYAKALYANGFGFGEITMLTGMNEHTLRVEAGPQKGAWKDIQGIPMKPEDSLRMLLMLFMQNLRKAIIASANDDFLETLPAYLTNLDRISRSISNWSQNLPLVGLKARIECLKEYVVKAKEKGNEAAKEFLLDEIAELTKVGIEIMA